VDAVPTDSILEEVALTFEIVEEGTNKRHRKLVSTAGFSYTVKVRKLKKNVLVEVFIVCMYALCSMFKCK
jgi:hypothetical protein